VNATRNAVLIPITDLLAIVAGDDALENQMGRELKSLADELNSSLPDYEVRLTHLDTEDYLEFIRSSDEEFIRELTGDNDEHPN